ncbi:MAG: hypothetical protein V3S24_04360, partial [Candidatus Tectomicrobia bacterium]
MVILFVTVYVDAARRNHIATSSYRQPTPCLSDLPMGHRVNNPLRFYVSVGAKNVIYALCPCPL